MFNAMQAMTFDNARVALEEGLRAIAGGAVAINLAGVTVVDSSAVAVLLAWQRAALEKSVTLMFDYPSHSLSGLAELYGVAALLNLTPAGLVPPMPAGTATVAPSRADLPRY